MRWLVGGALVLGMWASAPAEEEIEKLRRDIKALSVLQKLELTGKQRSQLVSIYKQFEALRKEHKGKLIELLERKKELLLSGRASREELIDLDGRIEEEGLRFRTEVEKLKAKAEDILTPEQRRKLERAWFHPKRRKLERAWFHPKGHAMPGRPPERFGPPPPGPSPGEMRERLFWRMIELLGETR